jgi:hypothetical protein
VQTELRRESASRHNSDMESEGEDKYGSDGRCVETHLSGRNSNVIPERR